MRKAYALLAVGALAALLSSAWAKPWRGGIGIAPPSPPCSTVCATTQNGQSFITWTDQATGATGDTWRYRVYESASAQNSGNCASGTLTHNWLANNSAQLLGGSPDVNGGTTYTQTHRQDVTGEMMGLSLAGAKFSPYTGLAVRTIPSNRTINYCVIAFNNTYNSGGHSDTYLGTTGSVVETAAPIQPILLRLSTARASGAPGIASITGSPAGMAVEYNLHASQSTGGSCSNSSIYGDFWVLFGDASMGYQDGIPTVFCVMQFHSRSPNTIAVFYRQTRWTPHYETPFSFEDTHNWVGSIPSVQTRTFFGGDTNPHTYPWDNLRLKYFWDFMKGQYNVGTTNWVLYGDSLGSVGVLEFATRWYPTYFAMCAAAKPRFRFYDDASPSGWFTINSAYPFGANLGTVASAVTFPDGTVWGGAGSYLDLPTYVASGPAIDLCPMLWASGRNDVSIGHWTNAIDMSNAYFTGKQFHSFVWNDGTHGDVATAMNAIWKQWGANSGGAQNKAWAYDEAWFNTNVAIPVFANSSFNDDPVTVPVGCRECGWQWAKTADTASHLAFTIQNNWMGNSPGTSGSGAALQPTGPQSGPFTSATTNITLGRRAQSWNPSPGTGVTCTNTPNAGAPAVQSLTADANGLVTFTGAITKPASGTMDCTIP